MSADLSEDLKKVIDQYLDGHRSRSLATLARVSGVAYTTLRRFAQREGNPTAEPVLKIVDATLGGGEKLEFIGKHFPEIARAVDRFNKPVQPNDEPSWEAIKNFYMRDPHSFILSLSISSRGTTMADVRRLCGERGIEALEEMVDAGVLLRDDATGAVHYREDSMSIADCDVILSLVRRSVDYFDRSLLGTKAARLTHLTATINEDALHKIHSLLTDTIAQIMRIKNDPKSEGDVPFFMDVMMNVLDKKQLLGSRGRTQQEIDDVTH